MIPCPKPSSLFKYLSLVRGKEAPFLDFSNFDEGVKGLISLTNLASSNCVKSVIKGGFLLGFVIYGFLNWGLGFLEGNG